MRQRLHRGVSLIEAAIILPLALLVAIALIDFALLGYTKAVLELAASRAAGEAVSSSAIAVDATLKACTVNDAPCKDFTKHLDAAAVVGERTARWAASPADAPSRITLVPQTMFDPAHYQGSWWNTAGITQRSTGVAILRPGEGVTRPAAIEGAPAEWFNHGMRPFGTAAGEGWPNPGEQWPHILARMPVEASICARVATFILGTYTVCGEQFGYYLGVSPSAGISGGGGTCGDSMCGGGETCSSCPQDCGTCAPQCGNSSCESSGGETCSSCPQDCGACAPSCGNSSCESGAGETCETCPQDCGGCVCGDGVCQNNGGGETVQGCCADCGSAGDGFCCASESCANAPNDCRCPVNTTCNTTTGACECTPQCPPNYCGPDGCGGTCACPFGQTCIGQTCRTPPQCGNGLFEPWGGEQCETDLDCCDPPNAPCVTTIATCDSCSCQYTERCPGTVTCSDNAGCAGLVCGPNEIPQCNLGCCGCVPSPSSNACGWHQSGSEWTCGGTCPINQVCKNRGLGEPCECVPQTSEPSPIPEETSNRLDIVGR